MNNKNLFIYGTSLDFISRVVFIISGFILNVIFARYFGAEKYGDLAIILSMLTLLNVFITNGVPNSLSKYMSNENIRQKDLYKKSLLIQLLVVIVIISLSLISINLLYGLGKIFYLKKYLYMILTLLPLNALFYLSIGVLNGLRDFKNQAIINIIYPVLRLICVLILMFYFKMDIIAVIIGTAIAYIPSIHFAFSKFRLIDSGEKIEIKEIVKFSLKIMGLFLLVTIFLNIDLIVIRSLVDNKKDVGVYGAMMSIGKIPYFILYSFSTIIFPIISNMKSVSNSIEIQDLLKKVFNLFLGVGALILLIIIFYSKDILGVLYGSEFINGYLLLPAYTFGIIGLSITSLIANILFVIDKKKTFLYAMYLMPIIEVVGIYLFFNKYGIAAAAFMFAISTGVMSLFLLMFLKHRLPASLSIKAFLFVAVFIFASVLLNRSIINIISIEFLQKAIGFFNILFFMMLYFKFFGKKLLFTNNMKSVL